MMKPQQWVSIWSLAAEPNFNGQKISTFDKEHGVQTAEHHKEVIQDLIARDKNHACVVMWSIVNEPDSTGEGAYEYFKPGCLVWQGP